MTLSGLLIPVKPSETEIEAEEVERGASSRQIGKGLIISSLNNALEPPNDQD